MSSFSPAELRRYARHITLPEVGLVGQERLKEARVLCVGAGGLGSPLALYLAAAGVGVIGLADFDDVDASNLQRQILHGTSDIGRPKLDSARERLREINPHVEVVRHPMRLDASNVLSIIPGYDVVADGTDNFPTRYLVNDACVLSGIPNVYGSVFRWEGQVAVFATDGGPCYRCLFRDPPPPGLVPDCAEGGVMGALPGVVGAMQALETMKLLLGAGEPLAGRLLIFDALSARWRRVELPRDPECPVCGDRPSQMGLIDYEAFCGAGVSGEIPSHEAGRSSSAPGAGGEVASVGAPALARALLGKDPPFVLDVREPWEWQAGNLSSSGAILVPLGELDPQAGELPRDREIVVCCRSGVRSLAAARLLAEAGHPRVANLEGGMKAWRDQVDPELEVV